MGKLVGSSVGCSREGEGSSSLGQVVCLCFVVLVGWDQVVAKGGTEKVNLLEP